MAFQQETAFPRVTPRNDPWCPSPSGAANGGPRPSPKL